MAYSINTFFNTTGAEKQQWFSSLICSVFCAVRSSSLTRTYLGRMFHSEEKERFLRERSNYVTFCNFDIRREPIGNYKWKAQTHDSNPKERSTNLFVALEDVALESVSGAIPRDVGEDLQV